MQLKGAFVLNKAVLKTFAIKARKKLIDEILDKLQMLALYSKTADPKFLPKDPVKEDCFLQLQKQIEKTDLLSMAEQGACIWFHRLVAIWFMEVNGYLPTEPFFSRFSKDGFEKHHEDTDTMEKREEMKYWQMHGYTDQEAAAQILFTGICRQLGRIFPGLFSCYIQPFDFLLPKFDSDCIIYEFFSLPKEDFVLSQGGQVEMIGWLYQYFHTERKEQTFALLQQNIKITKERIPAATQLFTPDWIVCYMVENSVGKLWLEQHPNPELEGKWTYYLKPNDNTETQKIRKTELRPQDITILDPCMGSGHILVYAFDILMDIYSAEGYTSKEAAKQIIAHNLYGLEIDDSVSELAHFAIMMKARFYDETILEDAHHVHICSIQESNEMSDNMRQEFWQQFSVLEEEERLAIDLVLDTFQDAKTYGSCLQMTQRFQPDFYEKTARKLHEIATDSTFDCNLEQWAIINQWFPLLISLLQQAALLTKTYLVTITNPPYMGKKSLNKKISSFLEANYPNGKSELYAAFILRCKAFTKEFGCFSMVTMHTWMFLTSFQKLRLEILKHNHIESMVHTGAATFEELNSFNVLASAFVIRKSELEKSDSLFIRLTDYLNTDEKINEYFQSKNQYFIKQTAFYSVPGAPFVYWASANAIQAFQKGTPLSVISAPRVGMQTGNNELFVRYWHEIDITKFYDKAKTLSDAIASGAKWFPYNKGGNFRKWYGMNEYVVDWENGGEALRRYSKAILRNEQDYFKAGITWSLFGFENFAVRCKTEGFLFDVSGSSMFPQEEQTAEILGFLCSKVAFYFLSLLAPTVNFQAGNVGDLPILPLKEQREAFIHLVEENCRISKEDWDDFETSWNFKGHPFMQIHLKYQENDLEVCYQIWKQQADSRYEKLKQNEEEINQILILLYQLEDRVTPEVIDRDIAVRKADSVRDVKLFLSYLVGCLFGRYHPLKEGIWYAGSEWNSQTVHEYAVKRNCLILKENELSYGQDDLASRLFELIEDLFGSERLEHNLAFIANALDSNTLDARQTIRTYLWRDFYKEHIRLYQKHPIYWQLNSGADSGYKALIYIHRTNQEDLYEILNQLNQYEEQLEQQIMEQEVCGEKKKNRYMEKRNELYRYRRAYQASIERLSCISLDDGVKQNYAKFQNLSVADENGDTYLVSLFTKI